jgi:cell wall-associated NlpC family hydrolase
MPKLLLTFAFLWIAGCATAPEKLTDSPMVVASPSPRSACAEFAETYSTKILTLADPANFPHTRYRKRPRQFPKETDCSHFVHQIFAQAGLPYRYRSTKEFAQAEEFIAISPRFAQPGDVVLYKSHMGILSQNFSVISATRQKPAVRELAAEAFRLGKQSFRVYRYRCPMEANL